MQYMIIFVNALYVKGNMHSEIIGYYSVVYMSIKSSLLNLWFKFPVVLMLFSAYFVNYSMKYIKISNHNLEFFHFSF